MKTRNPRDEGGVAIAVGVLYILATVAGISVMGTGAPTGLGQMAGAKGAVLLACLFELIMALSVAGIAFMLYPILARDADTGLRQGLAQWYLGSRITEGSLFLLGLVLHLARLSLGESLGSLPPGQGASLDALGLALKALYDYSWIAGQTAFCVGAGMLYYLLYRSRRIPRWLSLWGLVASPLMLVAGLLLPLTGDPNSLLSSILYAPMGLQEMVLAVWLILRGFRPRGFIPQAGKA